MLADAEGAYAGLDVVGDPITIVLRNDDGSYAAPVQAIARVSQFRLDELIAGSPARQGDFKALLRATWIPVGQRRLESRDRVLWRSQPYSVINYDDATHAVAGTVFAVMLWLRG
jgi:broad specificity polyphosphatase/5'/3'-nucleotidase SurE